MIRIEQYWLIKKKKNVNLPRSAALSNWLFVTRKPRYGFMLQHRGDNKLLNPLFHEFDYRLMTI